MYLLTYRYFLYVVIFITILLPAHAMAGTLKNKTAIDQFYLSREGSPLWIRKSKLNKSGEELLGVLRQSWQNGLNPDTYHVNAINAAMDKHMRFDKDRAIEIELLLTDGYINYVRDLSGMRINARDMELNPKHWRQRISVSDAVALLPNKNPAEFLLQQEPQAHTYQRLKSELIALVNGYDNGFSDEKLIFNSVVRHGRGYNNIPKLRKRFELADVEQQNRHIYDDELVAAITQFQAEKGLKPDGIIGKQTLRALNLTQMDKIKQIIANMERLRWIDDIKPERFVVVNIPSATLWAIDNGKVKFEMPVIVGRKKRPTLSFVTNIHGVRFNPTWTVPPTIKEEDILPELQSDPAYLAGKGMELYDGYGKDAPTLDPFAIDWNSVGKNDLHSLRMVQIPGKNNPLGRIRILMPNKHNIYLHDTNHKSLFLRADRAKSSGCVRMKHPEKMALFALEKRKNWSEKSMFSILDKGKIRDIYTPEKIRVYLLYYTVWLGDRNQIIYGSDIYSHDKTLLQLLEKLDGFNVIVDNDIRMVQVVD